MTHGVLFADADPIARTSFAPLRLGLYRGMLT